MADNEKLFISDGQHSIVFSSEPPKMYEIDFEKVTELADVIILLKALNVRVYENYQNFEDVKPYLKTKEDNHGL